MKNTKNFVSELNTGAEFPKLLHKGNLISNFVHLCCKQLSNKSLICSTTTLLLYCVYLYNL